MKKRRIRYSELSPTPPAASAPIAPPPPETPRVQQVTVVLPPVREARISTPVQLARALAEAREVPEPQARPSSAELLLFTVGAERFAVPLEDVDEAVDLPVVHFVP